MRFGKKIKFST